MSITVHCPKCGEVSTRLDKYAGATVTCDCGATFTIPPHNIEATDALAPSDAPALPEETALPPDRVAEFHRTLAVLTPHVYVTPTLVVINVLVFLVMATTGVSVMDPSIADLLRWGANSGPQTFSGEWWRLFTSTFVHIGIIHLCANMLFLAASGTLVERMVGNVGFLLLYVFAGLCGSLASLFWNPVLVSAGASGAVFGIYGALLGILLRQYGSIPAKALVQMRNSGVAFVAYNLVYGMMQPRIDNAAHIGGLAGGFLAGLMLSQAFTPDARTRRLLRNVLLAFVGCVLVVAGAIGVRDRNADLANIAMELERFDAVEKKTLDTLAKAEREQLTDPAIADLLERDVLPDWRAARERLTALKNVPEPFQGTLPSIIDYMRLRQEQWELIVQSVREENVEKMHQAGQRRQLADAAAKRIMENAGK